MFEDSNARWIRRRSRSWKAPTIPPRPIELWRLRGATNDVRGLAIETSFGYALGVELDTELVLLFLQPSVERLVAYADRLEAALIGHGWRPIDEDRAGRESA